MAKFKVGQKVWSLKYGKCVVHHVDVELNDISVEFKYKKSGSKYYRHYTLRGRLYTGDVTPDLYTFKPVIMSKQRLNYLIAAQTSWSAITHIGKRMMKRLMKRHRDNPAIMVGYNVADVERDEIITTVNSKFNPNAFEKWADGLIDPLTGDWKDVDKEPKP